MFAAKAGAKKVYAVECSAIAGQARQIVAANGYSDTIEVIQKKMEDIELPCKYVDRLSHHPPTHIHILILTHTYTHTHTHTHTRRTDTHKHTLTDLPLFTLNPPSPLRQICGHHLERMDGVLSAL
jgi:hypothetical protein